MPGIPLAYLEAKLTEAIQGSCQVAYKIVLKAGSQSSENFQLVSRQSAFTKSRRDYQGIMKPSCSAWIGINWNARNGKSSNGTIRRSLKATLTKTKGKEALKDLNWTWKHLQKSLQAWVEKRFQRKSNCLRWRRERPNSLPLIIYTNQSNWKFDS